MRLPILVAILIHYQELNTCTALKEKSNLLLLKVVKHIKPKNFLKFMSSICLINYICTLLLPWTKELKYSFVRLREKKHSYYFKIVPACEGSRW